MNNNFIREIKEEDITLITAYFEQALAHYEASGELIAMQDIKYFLQNMQAFNFFVKQESTEQVTYIFEFPATADGQRETGTLVIPFQNN